MHQTHTQHMGERFGSPRRGSTCGFCQWQRSTSTAFNFNLGHQTFGEQNLIVLRQFWYLTCLYVIQT